MKVGDMVVLKIAPNPMLGIVLDTQDDEFFGDLKFKVLWSDGVQAFYYGLEDDGAAIEVVTESSWPSVLQATLTIPRGWAGS